MKEPKEILSLPITFIPINMPLKYLNVHATI